ncbi:MAG: helix-turn-helix transcriptional regulator [Actinomyces sp.]|uniref:helix-turn-helix transcriptional regulator n=1 Tax=Actinomyces sp. TaxID=29317 RepID=UPI0026DD95C1|nr:helix-turn-helix transcriptional regulator [Actinomyces sp.]MDO4243602.1 helix-turn-helix transcriptional regulator [Actinomyces sp.]
MSIKHALLALLSAGDAGTYQLRKDFEASTGSTWPLNIGQVSTTLGRLERDGLVTRQDIAPAGSTPARAGSTSGGSEVVAWSLTEAGRDSLARWWSTPVVRRHPGRDELIIKLALAATAPGVKVCDLIQCQRQAGQAALHEITLARRAATEDLVSCLILDHHVYTLEAELPWLDDVEGRLTRARHRAVGADGSAPAVGRVADRHATAQPAAGSLA